MKLPHLSFSQWYLMLAAELKYSLFYGLSKNIRRSKYSSYGDMISQRSLEIGYKFRNEEWYRLLVKAKKDILANTINKYYSKTYEKQEIYYWMWIPRWIYLLKESNPLNRVLDIGCAYGTLAVFTKHLAMSTIYCLDIDDKYLSSKLVKKHGIKFKHCNIELEKVPFSEKFDLILLTDVIEHFNFNITPTLTKIKNILSDGGVIIVSTPDSKSWGVTTKYYNRYSEIPFPSKQSKIIDDHVWQFNAEELFTIADKVGLKVKKFEYSPGVEHRHINLMLSRK